MSDLVIGKKGFTPDLVLATQDYIAEKLPPVELQYEHHFGPGVYARVMKAPAGTLVVGKAHREDHICILLKGALTVTLDDGSTKYMQAPAIWTAKGGQKKVGYVHEDLEFVNVHANPTDTADLDEIESKVIIPEEEYRLALEQSKEVIKMTKNNIEVLE